MKSRFYVLLIFAHALFAMPEDIEQRLRAIGINPARIMIDVAKIGRIHYQDVRLEVVGERMSYWATYEEGSIGGTLWRRGLAVDIECNICIRESSLDGVMHIKEKNINPAHYHLLRMLYWEQEKKESLQYMDKIALE